MFRPSVVRLAATRPMAQASATRSAIPRPARLAQPVRAVRARTYANQAPPPPPPSQPQSSGGGGGANTLVILAAILAVGAGGYYYVKPVRDVAVKANQAYDSAASGAAGASDHFASLAKAALPPGAFALYSSLAGSEGGIGGFLNNLKDKDLQGVIDEVKKHGGDDAKRVNEKVEKKHKDAKGKVSDVDWQGLAKDLKGELPKDKQQLVDMFIGKVEDFDLDSYVKKAKELGQDKLKDVETASKKILDKVEQARKEGKGQADAFLKGLKEAAPQDVDELIKKLKEAAKSAGLPADQTEAWLKAKAEDGKVNAEQAGQQVVDRLKTVSKVIPGNPKDLTDQIAQISPSLAKLLQQALQQADIVDEKGNRK